MRLRMNLLSSPEDPPPRSPLLQQEYRRVRSTLDAAGVEVSQRSMVFDSADMLGYPLGEFILEFTEIMQPVLIAAITGWFLERKGRKVRFEMDDVVMEASTTAEIEKLVDLHKAIRSGEVFDSESRRSGPDSPKCD